jgi:hypothetical protein
MPGEDTDNKVVAENPKPDSAGNKDKTPKPQEVARLKEIGGREGPEPTRYGDWEKAGRCIDF